MLTLSRIPMPWKPQPSFSFLRPPCQALQTPNQQVPFCIAHMSTLTSPCSTQLPSNKGTTPPGYRVGAALSSSPKIQSPKPGNSKSVPSHQLHPHSHDLPPSEAPLPFRRPPPPLHTNLVSAAQEDRSHPPKQTNQAALPRPRSFSTRGSSSWKKSPTLPPLQPLTCTARSPLRRYPEDQPSLEELRVAGLGQGGGRGFLCFPASPPTKGRAGGQARP